MLGVDLLENSMGRWFCEAAGWFFLLQAALIFVGVGQIVYCCLTIRRGVFMEHPLAERLRNFRSTRKLGGNTYGDEIAVFKAAEDDQRLLGRLLRTGAKLRAEGESLGAVRDCIAKAMEEVGEKFDGSLRVLLVLAQLSLLVGLLATTYGLSRGLSIVTSAGLDPQTPLVLAKAVSQSLAPTMLSLCLTILAYGAYFLLGVWAGHILVSLEAETNRLLTREEVHALL